ncbi:hypothetical protein IID04_02845 [PVC group bacterium]|nr:hypothetical protein [PVC group bacterium]
MANEKLEQLHFPPFDLKRLLKTVFAPQKGEKICILIDLEDFGKIKDFSFLNDTGLTIQRYAHDVFYQGLKNGVMDQLGLEDGRMFAYRITGGSNLDLTDEAYDVQGLRLSLEKDIYSQFDIILCISTFSATAPLTASAKQYGFRGATLHGINKIILETGLSVDYEIVSVQAEKLRQGLTRAEFVEVDFEVRGQNETLKIFLDGQEAQKSHGICRGKEPAVANLPAGEVYFVPTGAEGKFPMKYDDGTLGWIKVKNGRIVSVSLIEGKADTIQEHLKKIEDDPVTGELGELGFGTQILPFSGQDIQDEKILGTCHIATGRSDHLGGHLTPDKFRHKINATHDDILFTPHKTPEIKLSRVRMMRDGEMTTLVENYQPSEYMKSLL